MLYTLLAFTLALDFSSEYTNILFHTNCCPSSLIYGMNDKIVSHRAVLLFKYYTMVYLASRCLLAKRFPLQVSHFIMYLSVLQDTSR